MPLFRVEGGRSVAVHPLSPARERFDVDVPALLTEHLDALLGEPLLLVQEGRTADEPTLLAVDGAGQPVVVEVVAVLDGAALLAALRSAGRVGRLGPQGLARVYRGGAEQYAAHLAAVRGAGPGAPVRVGSRLVIVVAEVVGVEDALDHLRQDG
ncbi:MAG TPA: hypothetical protein PLS68_12785, partial [Actinotalea sp.]|nr:hypothetical protein [Actinotalea sp.]